MTVEDRLRATTEALSSALREVRPLTLPPERPGRVSRPREPRRRPGWVVPLAAAVAVIAVAVSLVAVRDSRGASPAPPAPVTNSAAAVPRYYVELGAYTSANVQRDAIVGDSRTGKLLATIKPAAHLTFEGVTGTADGRSFVIDAIPVTEDSQAKDAPAGPHTWYLVRLAPGTSHPVTLTRLPVAALAGSYQIGGLALSANAGTLAILYQTGVRNGSPGTLVLQTFSLSTGKTLRTWTAAAQGRIARPAPSSDNHWDLTWTADGRTLAFAAPAYPSYARTLNVTRSGANLLADSRAVLAIRGDKPYDCQSPLLASNGQAIVCGTLANGPGACRQQWPEFQLYSTATGKLIRVVYQYRPSTCTSATAMLVWAGPDGTAIGVLQVQVFDSRYINSNKIDITVGLLTPGSFTPLHLSVPDNGGFDPGSLAF